MSCSLYPGTSLSGYIRQNGWKAPGATIATTYRPVRAQVLSYFQLVAPFITHDTGRISCCMSILHARRVCGHDRWCRIASPCVASRRVASRRSRRATPRHCPLRPRRAVSCHVVPCRAMSSTSMPHPVMTCHAIAVGCRASSRPSIIAGPLPSDSARV